MYVRRDVVQQLWDYGPEALSVTTTLPGDEYVERWEQRSALSAWGVSGAGPGEFAGPKGLATDSEGNIYVADTYNHRVQVFDANGVFLRQWGSEGSQPGQFKEPWALAVAANGDVYVADTWNHRIEVFDSMGAIKNMWGTFGEVAEPMASGDLLYGPRDVIIDDEGYLYVTDTGNKRIVKYDPMGTMVSAIGIMGDGAGQFQEPVGLAFYDGTLYVADTWNQRIQAFDTQLSFLRQWTVVAWEGMSVVNKPYLAVSPEGDLLVSDPEAYRLLQFDSEGTLKAAWGQYGSDMVSFNLPTGLVFDSLGRLLVADSENHRIMVFQVP